MDVDSKRGRGGGGRWRMPVVEGEDELLCEAGSSNNNHSSRPYRSPTLNINICFPKPVYDGAAEDDSSAESSSGENYIQDLWLHLSGTPNKIRDDGRRRNSPDREHASDDTHGFGVHKKRIITPPHKLRSNLLKSKKLRLEKAKNQRGSPSKSPRNPRVELGVGRSCGDKPTDDQVPKDVQRMLPFRDKVERKKSDKTQAAKVQPRSLRTFYDSDADSDDVYLSARVAKENSRPVSEPDPAVPSTSSGVRRRVEEDDKQDVVRRWLSKYKNKDAAKKNGVRSLDLLLSSDEDEPRFNGETNRLGSKSTSALKNDDSSDSELDYSWVGPSPRSRPASLSNAAIGKHRNSGPKESSTVSATTKHNKKPLCAHHREKPSSAVLPITPSTDINNANLPSSSHHNGDLSKSSVNRYVADLDSIISGLARKKNKEVQPQPPPPPPPPARSRYSSDADSSSSNDPIIPANYRRSLFGCRPKVYNVRNSSESEEAEPPAFAEERDVAPDSPGMAAALLKIQQIEADEAFARQLQFELNQDLYGGVGVPPTEEQSTQVAATGFVAPVVPNTSNGSRASQPTYPKRNPYTRTVGGRPPVHIPPAQVRSPQNRVPRGRLRRYPQPMSLLDSPVFSEPFVDIDDQLRVFISSLESDDEVDSVLTLNQPNRNRRGRRNHNGNELDEVIQAVIDGNEVGHRHTIRSPNGHRLLRRRSPRGHRQLRSTYALVPILMNDGTDYEDLLAFEERLGQVPVGMSRAQIHRLPTKQYVVNSNGGEGYSKGSKSDEEEENCHICLCDYDQGENLRILPCFHEFHTNCIDRWLQVKDTCPVCRMQVQVD